MKKTFSYIAILVIPIFFFILYTDTFRGHVINKNFWDSQPFGMESRIYEDLSHSTSSFYASQHFKVRKHYLCYLLYPVIHQLLLEAFPVKDSPLVCSFLVSLGIAIFGFWLYWRIENSLIAFPIILLLGFSFATWYNGAIWEARSFVAFGSIILLIALDRIIHRPSFTSLLLGIFSMTFMLLICVGNIYNIPLIPFALLTRVKHIGFKKFLGWSVIYLVSITLLFTIVYQASGEYGNWMFKIPGAVKQWRKDDALSRTDLNNLINITFYRRYISSALFYSVGALKLPAGARYYRRSYASSHTLVCEDRWLDDHRYQAYFKHLHSILFLIGYVSLIALTVITIIKNKLLMKEPIVLVFFLWASLLILFFIYTSFNWNSVRDVELQAPLWACFAIVLHRLNLKKIIAFLFLLLLLVVWNNWEVMQFFRGYYARLDLKPPPEKIIVCPEQESDPAKPDRQ